jgi:ABC-type multidrug transport system ATPase subunit
MQCALCRAFLGWPEIFLLDEPAVALDIKAYDHFCNLVHTAHSKNATIVISSHQLDAIEKLCTSIGILENGKLKIIDLNNLEQNKSKRKWLIKSNYKIEYHQIIENISGESPAYNNGTWTFTVSEDKSETVIPSIISNLTSKGC